MKLSESVLGLKNGAYVIITEQNSKPEIFSLNIGDALLNGDPNQVWLENSNSGKRRYVRRLPQNSMTIGPALFSSLTELARTLEEGDFYIA